MSQKLKPGGQADDARRIDARACAPAVRINVPAGDDPRAGFAAIALLSR